MPVTIPDSVLEEAKMSEREMLVEIACRLFETGRLDRRAAAQLAGLSRDEFWAALLERGIPAFTLTEEELKHDLETLDRVFPRGGHQK